MKNEMGRIDYETFEAMTLEGIRGSFQDNYQISVHTIEKENGVSYRGMTILDLASNISPVVNLDEYYGRYLQGEDFDTLFCEIIDRYLDYAVNISFDSGRFLDYEAVKGMIYGKLINTRKNQVFLSDYPNRAFLDLSLVYYLQCDIEAIGKSYLKINKNLMEQWGVDEETLYEQMQRNIQKNDVGYCRSLAEEMKEQNIVIPGMEDGPCFYILTNRERMFGAGVILSKDLRNRVSRLCGGDYYLIPSSVHEWLCVPATEKMESDELNEMVNEVNTTVLTEKEFLSDHVYLCTEEGETVVG